MAEIKKANGHRLHGLQGVLSSQPATVAQPDPDRLAFDLGARLAAVVALHSRAPEAAFSASYLGTEREGSAVLIDAQERLLLTIGYLVTECDSIELETSDGRQVQAALVGYDYETGFGVLRAADDIAAEGITLGRSADVREKDRLIVAARGGARNAINAIAACKREFAGYWEYLLDEAIFTVPPHPLWSGAGLLNLRGELVGIGSLLVQDAVAEREAVPGNMFVPVDLLKPILERLLKTGTSGKPPRPWLGMYVVEAAEYVVVSSCAQGGPAASAGLEAGDVIIGVAGRQISGIAELYRSIWSLGAAGTRVALQVVRAGQALEIVVASTDRRSFMMRPRAH